MTSTFPSLPERVIICARCAVIVWGTFSRLFNKPSGGLAFHLKTTIKKVCVLATKPMPRWTLSGSKLRNQPLLCPDILTIATSGIVPCSCDSQFGIDHACRWRARPVRVCRSVSKLSTAPLVAPPFIGVSLQLCHTLMIVSMH